MILSSQKMNLNQEFLEIENKKLWKIVLMSLREETEKETKHETFESARNPNNRSRNRYRDVLPYDSTRVKLLNAENSDYINASYVNLENNKYGRRYILTQGPLVSTMCHFWKMVWDEHSNCIIMLNRVIEKDTVKCAQYFPETELETCDYPEYGLTISLSENEVSKSYIKRVFSLQNEQTKEIRKITQFHYQSWPDFGVPSSSELFLKFLGDVRDSGGLNDPNQPAIVHCSAGIGRSGTFVLIDLALLKIDEDQSCNTVNLQQMLVQLRKCRLGLIQTAEQLRFAYLSIIAGSKTMVKPENNATEPVECSENLVDLKSMEISNSDGDTDLELSENSENDLALDKAADAVRTRRGLPPSKKTESSIDFMLQNKRGMMTGEQVIELISKFAKGRILLLLILFGLFLVLLNVNLHMFNSYRTKEICQSNRDNISHDLLTNATSDRKTVRENRRKRTNQMIEDIRQNMRQKNLERDRLMFKLGLKRLANFLTRQSRTTFIAGASTFVGIVSFACGYFAYKYLGY